MTKPLQKPNNPCFSSGPCAKRPGWSLDNLEGAFLGRSHRASEGKALLKKAIDEQKRILGIPDHYRVGIVPASDTGAFEMAMWSMLGVHGVDVFAWEAFSATWLGDIVKELKLENVNEYTADYGDLPDLSRGHPAHDTVFVWNGTTSGVRVPNGDWISDTREGLTFCDATSAVFAYVLPWDKLDVVTWSWQKVLGGEAAHGMIVLSPRAVERLETYKPPRALPKIFRMTKGGKINEGIFEGSTINTPSMLAVEDCLDALKWVDEIGGLNATIAKSQENFDVIANWITDSDVFDFLAHVPETRSTTSVCLKVVDPWFTAQSKDAQTKLIGEICKALDTEGAAYDVKSYRDAPPGLRIWCGATVQAEDIAAALPWIDWAYAQIKANKSIENAA